MAADGGGGDALVAALAKSADKAPKKLAHCAWDVVSRRWLVPEEVAALSQDRQAVLLHGFEYQVARTRLQKQRCRRCGSHFEKGELRVSYPAAAGGELGRHRAEPVWLHIRCCAKDRRLAEVAEAGDRLMRKLVLGYMALEKSDRLSLCGELVVGDDAVEPPEENQPKAPAVPPRRQLQKHPTPPSLKVRLLPFQREGLWWMLQQEEAAACGGILADEMGLGKTLQVLSLLLASALEGPTLVVVHASGLLQWRDEVLRMTKPGAFEVLLHHGAEKSSTEVYSARTAARLLVLTTYATLEREHRARSGRQRSTGGGDGEGPAAPRPAKRRRLAEVRKEQLEEPPCTSPLLSTPWARVVLDEAHRIKSVTTSTAQAAFALQASASRWCVSGTPLQNRVGELYSMVRFLRFAPYAHASCNHKDCSCTVLHSPRQGGASRGRPLQRSTCPKCGHGMAQHRSHFATAIAAPMKRYGLVGKGREALEKLRLEVLDRLLLRRTKADCARDVRLPPIRTRERHIVLSASEAEVYKDVVRQSGRAYDALARRGEVLSNFAHVFGLLMKRRQATLHPDLATPVGEEGLCAICRDGFADSEVFGSWRCGHMFHLECREAFADEEGPEGAAALRQCPRCPAKGSPGAEEGAPAVIGRRRGRHPAARRSQRGLVQRLHGEGRVLRSSSKIEALVEELRAARVEDGACKALVFSQFTGFLELIAWRLAKEDHVRAAMLIGSMPVAKREEVLASFRDDASVNVLLISLKVGGEGLNLQMASHVFLMDPWWNASAEQQAVQRAHRIGQTNIVHAVRFVAKGTIEEKILELQVRKQLVFDAAIGASNAPLAKLTAQDIDLLFAQ